MTVWGFFTAGSDSNSQTESENLINPSNLLQTRTHIFWEDKHVPGGKKSTVKNKNTQKKQQPLQVNMLYLCATTWGRCPKCKHRWLSRCSPAVYLLNSKDLAYGLRGRQRSKPEESPVQTRNPERERATREVTQQGSKTQEDIHQGLNSQSKTTNWQTKK